MGTRSLVIAGAVVLVVVTTWTLALDRKQPHTPHAPHTREPSAAPMPEPPREPASVAQPATAPSAPDDTARPQPEPAEQPAAPAQAPAPSQPAQAPEPSEDVTPLPAPTASGPIAELTHAFQTEPRDSAAQQPESRIQDEFKKSDIKSGMLKSVLCRKSVCKIEVVWTPERATSFIAAFTRLSADFAPVVAIDPQGTQDEQSRIQIDVYMKRAGAEGPATSGPVVH